MVEMLLKAQKYMNTEDALAIIKDVEKLGDKGRKEDNRRRQKRERPNRQTNDGGKRKDEKTPQTVKFTPLVMHVDKILMQIKNKHYLKWPRPLHSFPQRPQQEEVLPVPQGSRSLHRGLQGPKGTAKGAYTERETAEVCEKRGIQ